MNSIKLGWVLVAWGLCVSALVACQPSQAAKAVEGAEQGARVAGMLCYATGQARDAVPELGEVSALCEQGMPTLRQIGVALAGSACK